MHDIKGENNKVYVEPSEDLIYSLKINGNDNKVEIDKTVTGHLSLDIEGDYHFVCVKSRVRFNGQTTIVIRSQNCTISVDEDSYCGGASFHLIEPTTSITIGKQCIISVQTNFFTSDYHSIIDLNTGLRINPAGNITISDHVWIGIGVIVLKGVTIGKDSVIGARSVVSKDIPNNVLAAGVPAKAVKENITWDWRRLAN